jgi:hypothetical protein
MILHITARSAINFFLQQNFCINFFILLFLYFIIYFLIFSLIHCSGVLLLLLLGPPHSSSLHGSSSCLEPLLSGPVCCLLFILPCACRELAHNKAMAICHRMLDTYHIMSTKLYIPYFKLQFTSHQSILIADFG